MTRTVLSEVRVYGYGTASTRKVTVHYMVASPSTANTTSADKGLVIVFDERPCRPSSGIEYNSEWTDIKIIKKNLCPPNNPPQRP